jgi:hypothetical protein
MASNITDIRQVVRQLLRDEFDVDGTLTWEDDELDVHINECLRDISLISSCRVTVPVIVTANSKLLDISGISDIINVRTVEYEPGEDPRSYHNFTFFDNTTLEMDVDSTPSESGAAGTLDGTITFTSGSPAVTGSGTAFSTVLEAGDYIKPSGGVRWYRVYSITSATALTLDEPVKAADTGADTIDVTQYRSGVAVIHYDTLHTLTELESTLNPKEEQALKLGVQGGAAISKARSLTNAINYGGTSVPDKMQNWGLTKLQLYQQALRGLGAPRTKKSYTK